MAGFGLSEPTQRALSIESHEQVGTMNDRRVIVVEIKGLASVRIRLLACRVSDIAALPP